MRISFAPTSSFWTLAGWGQAEDKRLAEEAGFDAHLTKPVDLADLEELLVAVEAKRSCAGPGQKKTTLA